jgi:hypothetical protein
MLVDRTQSLHLKCLDPRRCVDEALTVSDSMSDSFLFTTTAVLYVVVAFSTVSLADCVDGVHKHHPVFPHCYLKIFIQLTTQNREHILTIWKAVQIH